ncbi:MAG: acetolactate synthase small subunit, partial [Candidatus Bathyarchaeia archaeon]
DQARMTITVNGDEYTVEQIIKQLNKLINVIKVAILEAGNMVLRELVLIKIHTSDSKARSDLLQYTNIFRGRVIDVSPDAMIIEVTGDTEKVDAFIELSRSFGIKEISRTGTTALNRGGKVIRE